MPLRRLLAALALLIIVATPSFAYNNAPIGDMCGDANWDFFEVPLDDCPGGATLSTMDETCEYFASEYTLENCSVCADISLPAEACIYNGGNPNYYFDYGVCYATHEESCQHYSR